VLCGARSPSPAKEAVGELRGQQALSTKHQFALTRLIDENVFCNGCMVKAVSLDVSLPLATEEKVVN
jgi:hypothetical protein